MLAAAGVLGPAAVHAQETMPSTAAPAGPTPSAPAAEYPSDEVAEPGEPDPCTPPIGHENDEQWLDRMQRQLSTSGCKSARWIDGLFGQKADYDEYRQVSGNIAPSLLWSEYDGFTARMRFRIDLPLPQYQGKVRAFVGRVDREEFVTERAEPSGALPRQFGATGDEQTLLGLGFGDFGGTGFDLGAGIRLTTPLDPFVKASYRWIFNLDSGSRIRVKPVVFWQQSEQFGVTTRVDYDRALAPDWYLRLTLSGTESGRSQGIRGYTNATVFHRLSDRKAMAVQVGVDGETQADVPLREYGVRTTYRQNILREWLVIELRASLTWPREERYEPRKPSWGAGLGFEMVFGPGTFRGTD
jgi:hypothetical protein